MTFCVEKRPYAAVLEQSWRRCSQCLLNPFSTDAHGDEVEECNGRKSIQSPNSSLLMISPGIEVAWISGGVGVGGDERGRAEEGTSPGRRTTRRPNLCNHLYDLKYYLLVFLGASIHFEAY